MITDKYMYDIYEEYYSSVSRSKAFSMYCKKVFGIDLSQDGFCDLSQMDFMIDSLCIGPEDMCLDIGCGNGRIADYVSKKTNADVVGVDYSITGIDHAKRLIKNNSRLRFNIADINELEVSPQSYTVIYMIDTIYFSNDYERIIANLYEGLTKDGRLGIYYSDFVFDKNLQKKKIEGNETKIANVLDKLKIKYNYTDFTKDHFKHMKRKNKISIILKPDFIRENNEWLFEKVNQESTDEKVEYVDFILFTNRYFYRVLK